MITEFSPPSYTRENPLPSYVTDIQHYKLLGRVPGGYTITLAEMIIGESLSAGTELTHVLFRSYTDHGERMAEIRTRASGFERQANAMLSAMSQAGVKFNSVTFCKVEKLMETLADWFRGANPEIEECYLVSQSRH